MRSVNNIYRARAEKKRRNHSLVKYMKAHGSIMAPSIVVYLARGMAPRAARGIRADRSEWPPAIEQSNAAAARCRAENHF